jgi:hypothetical protein
LKQTYQLVDASVVNTSLAKPRPQPFEMASRQADKTPWAFHTSIFRDYKADTAKILDKCFEADWANSKIERICKDP